MKAAFNFFWIFLWSLQACGQMTFDEKMESLYRYTVPLIRTKELTKRVDHENLYLLDIRSEEEYAVSHIPGARLIDYESFNGSAVRDIPLDAEVVVYCSVGYRSERVGEQLKKKGYLNVKNLYGGIFDWKNQGNDVFNLSNQPTDSVHTYNEDWSQWLYKGVKVYE